MERQEVLIVGAGFAGLYMLHAMREAGRAALVIEQSGGVGGVWYRNRYPGARCDVESLQYSYSFSEELQQDWCWTERYAAQPEILRYAEHVARRFDLLGHIRFGVTMRSAEWDGQDRSWVVTTAAGEVIRARFLVMAAGSLSNPSRPAIAGLDRFAGEVLHTACWPHDPVDFSGKRVGIVGTGSTGVQVITEVARQAARLTVFQRTANYVLPSRNGPLTEDAQREWKSSYAERRRRARELPTGVLGDYNNSSALAVDAQARNREFERRWSIGGFQIMMAFNDFLTDQAANDTMAEFVRAKVRSRVHDPETARKLLPTEFPIGTKRVCLEDGYYDVFNQDNVELVSIKETPIEEVVPEGVVLSDRLIELDTIILATGFDAITGSLAGVTVKGETGEELSDHWKAGPRSFLGFGVAGFPNLFLISGPGSPIGRSNAITSIEQNVEFIATQIRHLDEHGYDTVQPTEEAEAAWTAKLVELADRTLYMKARSWWNGANIPGKPRVFMIYAGGVPSYVQACSREAGLGFPSYRFG